MSQVKSVLKSRVIKGGHAIEFDLLLEDDSTQITEIPYERIPMMMHALSNAGAFSRKNTKRRARRRINRSSSNLSRSKCKNWKRPRRFGSGDLFCDAAGSG